MASCYAVVKRLNIASRALDHEAPNNAMKGTSDRCTEERQHTAHKINEHDVIE